MKKASTIITALILLAIGLIFSKQSAYAGFSFAGGEGTEASPWQIATCEQLQNIDDSADYLDDYFVLIQNIDCSMTNPNDSDFDSNGTWGDETGFDPIGDNASPFIGNFDGSNFSITGLYINRAETSSEGLFSYLGGYVYDLNLVDVDITVEGDFVGALAGEMCGSDIEENIVVNNVSSSGSVAGIWHVGGLIGGSTSECSYPGQIVSSHSSTTINGTIYVGGLVGEFLGEISNSYVTGDVTGTGNYVGGMVGMSKGDISDSYASGNVTSNDGNVGGLVGEQTGSFISNCFASGEVAGVSRIGGLVGELSGSGVIEKSYASGLVNASEHFAGGLVGYSYGLITDSYATGNVLGVNYLGGLIGQAEASIYRSYAIGEVNGQNNIGGFVGGIFTEGPAVDVYSSFSTGAVVSSGGNIGGFAGLANMNQHNSGWVVITGRPAIGYSMGASAPVSEIEYNETSSAVFFDATHGVYTAGEDEDVWDFSNIWIENENDYPTLRDMPEERQDEPTPTPTSSPSPAPASTTAPTKLTANKDSGSSSSSRRSSSSTPSCSDVVPATTPDLFQINSTLFSANLFFTPSDHSQYFISFSTNPNAEEFGELVNLSRDGVQSHHIYHLKPYTTYYIKVRSQNGCMPGNWSNTMMFNSNSRIYYKNSLPVQQPASSAFNQTTKKVNSDSMVETKPSESDTQPPEEIFLPQPTSAPETSEASNNPAKKCFLWWCW